MNLEETARPAPGGGISSLRTSEWVLAKLHADLHVLDAGAGGGELAAVLASRGLKVLAMDLALPDSRPPSVDWMVGDIREIPLETASMDAVTLRAVLTVLPEPRDHWAAIGEVARVLRPGGLLYIADFLRNDDSALYRKRYREAGGEGLLRAEDAHGKVLYTAKHWTVDELVALTQRNFHLMEWRDRRQLTRSGNEVNGFEALYVRR